MPCTQKRCSLRAILKAKTVQRKAQMMKVVAK